MSLTELISLYTNYRGLIWVEGAPDYYGIKSFVEKEYKKKKRIISVDFDILLEYNFPKTGVFIILTGVDNNALLWSYYNNHTGFSK